MNKKDSILRLIIFLVVLTGCSREEFGTAPKKQPYIADPQSTYSHSSCSTYTLIKPKVDVLYVIDNSSSSFYIADDVKKTISTTVSRLSSDFDLRVVGTPLLETSKGNNEYQVLTNSPDLSGIPTDSRRISSAGEFTFFSQNPIPGIEKGVGRVISFINSHKKSLLRSEAYLIVVLISNGRDLEIEEDAGFGNGETTLNSANYLSRLGGLRNLKHELQSIQLRMITVTAKSVCQAGWRSSNLSYVKVAKQLYEDSGAQDSEENQDSYDLCESSGISSIFAAINDSIQQVVVPHQYRYWPITFAENNEMVSLSEIKVHKITPSGASQELNRDVDWVYVDKGSAQLVNTRELPSAGEPVMGRHFIRFNNLLTYPDCVVVTSVSRTEYFDYIVLPQRPRIDTVVVKINGKTIPQSSTNGWSDETSTPKTINIKAPYPSQDDENPPVIRTGFMLKLNGTQNYYKSGDSVEVTYIPTGI